eukprot:1691272-Prymnesium_polylepis.1
MNLGSEVPERMLANRKQRERGHKQFNLVATSAVLGALTPSGHVSEHEMEIELNGAVLHGEEERSTQGTYNPLLQPVDLKFKQGKIYAVVGVPSNGKSSLLRLIAKVVHPTAGEVYVPPHLHIVHVENQPQIMDNLSLFENLVFGFRFEYPPIERVCAVCEAVGLSEKWIDHLWEGDAARRATAKRDVKSMHGGWRRRSSAVPFRMKTIAGAADYSGGLLSDSALSGNARSWQRELSHSEKQLISLARALLTAPHLLVLHRPFAGLDDELASKVAQALRKFVTNRGHVGDGEQDSFIRFEDRDPRTVIFTCSTHEDHAMEIVDDVVVVGHNVAQQKSEHQIVSSSSLRMSGAGSPARNLRKTYKDLFTRPRHSSMSPGGRSASCPSMNGELSSAEAVLSCGTTPSYVRQTESMESLLDFGRPDTNGDGPAHGLKLQRRESPGLHRSHGTFQSLLHAATSATRSAGRNTRKSSIVDLERLL